MDAIFANDPFRSDTEKEKLHNSNLHLVAVWSTENNLTPLQLFNNNKHLPSLHSATPQQDLRASYLPRRPPICNPLSDEFYRNLCQEIDPLMNISRIDLYKQVIEYVGNCLLEM